MLRRRSLHSFFRRWYALFACLACGAASAQTVGLHLRNGDRVSGALVSESTNNVVISNSWAGKLSIPLAEIVKREFSPVAPPITNLIVLTNNLGPVPVTLTNKTVVVQNAATNRPQRWHGEVQIGTDLGFSEKDRQLYYGRMKFIYGREIASGRFLKETLDGNATYGRTDGVTSANQANGSSKTDYDLPRHVFIYNLGGVGYDEVRKIDLQFEGGPGVGYHLIRATNFVLNTEIGMNYQAQYFNRQKTLERYFYRLAEESKWVITSKLSFDQKFEFFPVENLEQFRLRFESNLRYTFLEKFIFTLTVLESYDTQSANNVSPNDLQIRSSLGLKF